MSHAFIEYASRDTTANEVQDAFQRVGFNVTRIEESITQDYMDYWKSFTIFFEDEIAFSDTRALYYTNDDFWVVRFVSI
jgi:hypothetical protein